LQIPISAFPISAFQLFYYGMLSGGCDYVISKTRQIIFSQYLFASVRPAGGSVRVCA
jgi:hypothetical protein